MMMMNFIKILLNLVHKYFMGKNIEKIISDILAKNPNNVFILNQLVKESETRNFVVIDNRQNSCTEQDLFYINTYEIAKLENFLDIDGYYKIVIDFTDGRELVLEYYEPVKMASDYEKLFEWFKKKDTDGDDYDTDIEDSDSDSDYNNGGGTEVQPVDVFFELTVSGNGATPSLLLENAEYLFYANTSRIQYFDQSETMVYDDVFTLKCSGEYIYANIFYKLIEDYDNPNQNRYVIETITLHETQEEAEEEEGKYPSFSMKTIPVIVNGYPTNVGDFSSDESWIYTPPKSASSGTGHNSGSGQSQNSGPVYNGGSVPTNPSGGSGGNSSGNSGNTPVYTNKRDITYYWGTRWNPYHTLMNVLVNKNCNPDNGIVEALSYAPVESSGSKTLYASPYNNVLGVMRCVCIPHIEEDGSESEVSWELDRIEHIELFTSMDDCNEYIEAQEYEYGVFYSVRSFPMALLQLSSKQILGF